MVFIDNVYIFDTAGSPLVMFNFSQKEQMMHETLFSGFLSAIQGFSMELFQNQSSHFVIDNGLNKITVFKGKNIAIAVISDQPLIYLKSKFEKHIQFFETDLYKETSEVLSREYYEPFRLKLVRSLFFLPIAEDWIPYYIPTSEKREEFISSYPSINEIDGTKRISDFSCFEHQSCEDIYEILNLGFLDGIIGFHNMLEPRDYIKGQPKLTELLSSNTQDFKMLKNQYSQIDLIKFIKELHQPIRIQELQDCFGLDLVKMIENLYDQEYIDIIDEKYRQILIAIDICNDFLNILQRAAKKQKILPDLQKILSTLDTPEIPSRINLNEDRLTIDKSDIIPKFAVDDEIKRLTDMWLHFASELIATFYKEYKNKLNEMFYQKIVDQYMTILHNRDMALLDPLLSKIEAACTD